MSERQRAFNPGIALLKLASCFLVVCVHTGIGGNRFTLFAVPTFMFLSMYLSARWLVVGDMAKLLRRIRQLFVPFAVWSGISWLLG